MQYAVVWSRIQFRFDGRSTVFRLRRPIYARRVMRFVTVAPADSLVRLLLYAAPRVGALRIWWRLSDVCLSVAFIGPKSGTERPRKTKIGTDVAHVTRDSDTSFRVKRSKVNLQERGILWRPPAHSLFSKQSSFASKLQLKSAQRDANTARALAVVRFGHRPPAVTTPARHRQDRLQYTVPLSLARSVMT